MSAKTVTVKCTTTLWRPTIGVMRVTHLAGHGYNVYWQYAYWTLIYFVRMCTISFSNKTHID